MVNKGREGWNCRSLFSVALFRSPKSKVFVLQATMRCLRKITDTQQTATVYLSKDNMDILDDELKKNFRTSIEELKNKTESKRKQVSVRVKEPLQTIKMKRLHYEYFMETKQYSDAISFGIDEHDAEHYDAVKYVKDGMTTGAVVNQSEVNNIVEKYKYSEVTLVAEIAKYFPNVKCTEISKMLRESKDGMEQILTAVNEHNEIIYDILVPIIFKTLYSIDKTIVKENVEVRLLKKPKTGGTYQFSGNEDLIVTQDSNDSIVSKNKDKSFHADTYVFDSMPEKKLFLKLLASRRVEQTYLRECLPPTKPIFTFHI